MLTILPAVLLLHPLCSLAADDAPQRQTITAMGGIPINISAWGIDQPSFKAAVTDITVRIETLEAMISTYRPASAVSRLNSGEILSAPPAELGYLVYMSTTISQSTDGAFDITVKPLVQLWRSCRISQALPTEAERLAALDLVDYRYVLLGADGQISFTRAGVMLDFGGIAKGYFADEAIAILKLAGAKRCLVDCGGDITSWQADSEQGRAFRVGIRDPQGGENIFAILDIPAGAVVTSGDYERFYEIGGEKYCHIFDPRTGQPVQNMLSVTLLAPTGIEADAYATAVFVMGAETGRQYVEDHAGLEAVIISRDADDQLEVFVSSGLIGSIEFSAVD